MFILLVKLRIVLYFLSLYHFQPQTIVLEISIYLPSSFLPPSKVSSDSVNRTFTALVICEKGNEEGEGKGDSEAFPHLFNTALFIPEGLLGIIIIHPYMPTFLYL